MGFKTRKFRLVNFEIVIDGGMLLDKHRQSWCREFDGTNDDARNGEKDSAGTGRSDSAAWASINVFATTEDIRISVNTLARNYQPTLALVEEILFEPRWDEKEFGLIKQSILSQIRNQESSPNTIANNNYNVLIYGKDNIRSRNILGTADSVNAITINDLKAFYDKNMSPSVARMHVVGALNKTVITSSLRQNQCQMEGEKS